MIKDIHKVATSEYATGALYIGLLGLLLSDIIPTPADALYFHLEKKLRDKWKNNEITPEQYWKREAIYYYGLNPLWWGLVIAMAVSIKGDAKKKMNVALALVGTGAVVGVIYKNIKQDIKEAKLNREEMRDLMFA